MAPVNDDRFKHLKELGILYFLTAVVVLTVVSIPQVKSLITQAQETQNQGRHVMNLRLGQKGAVHCQGGILQRDYQPGTNRSTLRVWCNVYPTPPTPTGPEPKPTCVMPPPCVNTPPYCALAPPPGGWCPITPTPSCNQYETVCDPSYPNEGCRPKLICVTSPPPQNCLQVITPARNTSTGECKLFGSSCLPDGWILDKTCNASPTSTIGSKACGARCTSTSECARGLTCLEPKPACFFTSPYCAMQPPPVCARSVDSQTNQGYAC